MSATSTAALTGTGTGVIPAPEGVTPDLKDPERHYHTANLVVVIVGVTVSTLCLLVRVYTRVVIVRKWLLDDGECSRSIFYYWCKYILEYLQSHALLTQVLICSRHHSIMGQ